MCVLKGLAMIFACQENAYISSSEAKNVHIFQKK